jgi:hypothetical protein
VLDVLDLFPRKIIPEPNSGCWLCTSSNNQRGYGRLYINGHLVTAHRYSYEISVGPIPDGLELDHLCRQPCCVNPAHLEPVTPFENGHRAAIAREVERNFHCKNGHKRTLENTFFKPNGAKVCNECRRESRSRWVEKNQTWKPKRRVRS